MIESNTLEDVGVPLELDAQIFWAFDGPTVGTAIALTDGAEDFSLVDLEDGVVIDRSTASAGRADASRAVTALRSLGKSTFSTSRTASGLKRRHLTAARHFQSPAHRTGVRS